MYRKKLIISKNLFILWLINIYLLSGCGQNDRPLPQVTDNPNIAQEESKSETTENNDSSEDLQSPLEVPVNTRPEDVYYHNEDNIDLLRAVHRCVSDGENIYLAFYEPDLYVMSISANKYSQANIDNPEEMKVCNVAVDTYGRIHLLMADQNNGEWSIWRLDKDYQIDRTINVSAHFETTQPPFWFLIDENGTYYFQWLMDRNGIIIDSEGILKHKLTLESLGIRWIYEAAVGKDGRIYFVYGTNQDKKREVGRLDVESGSIKSEYPALYFPSNETFAEMSGGTDTNLLLYSPISGVWAYDSEQGIMENRVPLSDIGFDIGTEFWPLTFLPDGRLLLLGQAESDNQTDNVNLLLKYIPAGN